MAEKLDFVAAYSRTSLYDSLAALCSWAAVSVSTATAGGDSGSGSSGNNNEQLKEKEQKMAGFFESQALEILLATIFSDESQQLLTRPEVKGALQALLQHVLLLHPDGKNSSGSGGAKVFYLIDALEQLVRQIGAVRSAQVVPAFAVSGSSAALLGGSGGDTSNRGSQMLAQKIAACIRKLFLQLNLTSPPSSPATAAGADGDSNVSSSSNADKAEQQVAAEFVAKLGAVDAQLAGLERPTAGAAGAKKPSTTAAGGGGSGASQQQQEKEQEAAQKMFLKREIHSDKFLLCLEVLFIIIIGVFCMVKFKFVGLYSCLLG